MANTIPTIRPTDEAKAAITKFGFSFGSINVERLCALPKGGAAIRVETPKMALTITATKTGKLRVTTDAGIEVLVTK